MADLSVSYLNCVLKNPIIASSSGLTNSVDNITKLEKEGVGAVVLKSLFEEQINGEISHNIAMDTSASAYPEAEEYITNYIKDHKLSDYISLITSVKKETRIPIIASINCVSSGEWVSFAKEIERAGADAIELNMFILPGNKYATPAELEQQYFNILATVRKACSLPIAIKLGVYFTNLLSFIEGLKARGASAVVLFNRFYEPDIDTENLKLTHSDAMSHPVELRKSLRWTGILSHRIQGLDISCSTGVHDANAVIKLLLAGANTVQVCSVLYQKGIGELANMVTDVHAWMKKKNFSSVAEFRGKLSYANLPNPAIYERSQFMKYFSNADVS